MNQLSKYFIQEKRYAQYGFKIYKLPPQYFIDNYSINIIAEKSFHFSIGEIYLIQTKIELDKKELFSSSSALYLNYPFVEANKVIPFFENLEEKERKRIVNAIQVACGYKLRTDDLLGKLFVALYLYIESYDLLIVGLVGLSDNSINALVDFGKRIVSTQQNKTIILTKTSSEMNGPVIAELLSSG